MVPMTTAVTASAAAALATTRSRVTIPAATADDAIASWTDMFYSLSLKGLMSLILAAGPIPGIVPQWTMPAAVADAPHCCRRGSRAAGYRERGRRGCFIGTTHPGQRPTRVPA